MEAGRRPGDGEDRDPALGRGLLDADLRLRRQGGTHPAVWHENRKSLALKTALVTKYHLAGASVWSLGHGNKAFWETLQAAMKDGPGS